MDNKYIERLVEVEARSKSNTKRIDEQEDKISQLEKTYSIMEKMDYRMGQVEDAVGRIENKISNESDKKLNKWETIADYLFKTIVGILIGYIAIKLGIK